jgi:hypothetical protein
MSKIISSALLILLLVGVNANAVMHNWTAGGGADRSWTTGANWDQGAAPTLLDETKLYYVSDNTTGPLVNTSDAVAYNARIGGPGGGATWCTLTVVEGGVLNLSDWIMAGTDSGSVRSGELYMTGGTINCGTVNPINGHLFVAHSATGTQGFINMSGGTINATGLFAIAYNAGTIGTVNLSGGTISSDRFEMNPSGLGTASMDISGTGMVIINGDVTGAVATYAANGWLTGNGTEDDLMYDYNVTNPGKTTVWAIPEPATICILAIGAFGLRRRK